MQIECDQCEQLFDAPEEKAGGKMPCPHCGDVNRIPELDSPLHQGLPSEDAPETTITIVRKSMFRAHPFRYIFIVLLFLGGLVVAAITPMLNDWPNWLIWAGLVTSLLALIWWVFWWISATLWVRLTLTNKRTIRTEGIVRRHTSEVLHDHVRNVAIRQSFFDRVMRVGYIGIASAGQKGVEIEVTDIPHPDKVKAIIDQYRKM